MDLKQLADDLNGKVEARKQHHIRRRNIRGFGHVLIAIAITHAFWFGGHIVGLPILFIYLGIKLTNVY